MTQKEFVIGLIEKEIDRDLTQQAAVSEINTNSEEMAEEQVEEIKEQNNNVFSDDFEVGDEDIEEEQDEVEEMGMTMGM